MDYIPQFLTIAAVVLLACVSPGPDFIAVTSHALASRQRGLGVALGTSLGICVWAVMAVIGLGVVLTQVAVVYDTLRLVGVCYLLYLGIRMLLGARRPYQELKVASSANSTTAAPRIGFLVSMTNPKAAVFFGSFFITVLPQHAPTWVLASTVAVVTAVSLLWFSALALMFSTHRVRLFYAGMRRPIDALMGAALVGLGAHLALTR